jgi:predicted TIM-barrel fold metal-dependent hydrolase
LGNPLGATIVSSDSHVVEPPDLFTSRMERRFRDAAPRVIEEGGADWWLVDDEIAFSASAPARAGERFEGQEQLRPKFKFERVRPAAYVPSEFIAENEVDGVYASVLYPSLGIVFFSLRDSALLSAVCRTYNDWVAEFCRFAPDRLKAVAMINLDEVSVGVREMTRAREKGLVGAMVSVLPQPGHTYDMSEYEPFWAAAEELQMPISLHVASNRTPGEWKQLFRPSIGVAGPDYWVRQSLGDMIFSGVFERYPGVRVASLEHEAGWVPHFLERMDYAYTQTERAPEAYTFKAGALPSDFFKQSVRVSFQEDRFAMRNLQAVGVGNLMFGSDYPHTESTYPRTQEILDSILEGVSAQDRIRMTVTNTAELYGLVF